MDTAASIVNVKLKRTANISGAQRNCLIGIMETEGELRQGKFTSSFTYKDSQKKWLEIASTLNSIPGAHKSWEQWKKTWQDMKKQIKKKKTQFVTLTNQTGGGPPPNTLSESDEKLLSLLDKTALDGDCNINETEVIFEESDALVIEHSDAELPYELETVVCSTNTLPEESVKFHDYGKENIHIQESPKKKENFHTPKRKHPLARKKQNLVTAVETSKEYLDIVKNKVELKERYYTQKLQLMEEQNGISSQINKSLQEIIKLQQELFLKVLQK